MNNKANRKEKHDMIVATNGHIFSATFVKKDNSLREIVCRLGVTKHLSPDGGYNTLTDYPQYVTVFDMKANSYKALNLDTLLKLKVNGKEYSFEGE